MPVGVALGLGFVLGQVPVGFRSFHAAEVKLMAWVGLERAPLSGENLTLFRKLNGCPSWKTITVPCAFLRPSVNSAFAASSAKAVSLVPLAEALLPFQQE